jgi:hypothetical protein
MSYNLVLNSSNAISSNPNQSNIFQYNFPSGSFTVPEKAKMMVSQITVPYSWRNISSALGNNTFTYYIPNSSNIQTAYTVTIADGFYTTEQINDALHAQMFSNGHYWYDGVADTYTGQSAQFTGAITSTTTLTVSGTTVLLFTGYVITFINATGVLTSATITATSGTPNVYTISPAQTNIAAIAMVANNGSEVNPVVVYPLSISTNQSKYTTTITAITIPVKAEIPSVFGFFYRAGDGLSSQTTWTGGYPTVGTNCAYIVFPSTSSTTNTIANILGFTSSGTTQYPSTNSSLTVVSQSTNGNSLSAQPPFPPKGSAVNGVIVRCNLVDNPVSPTTDVLDCFPITSQYGSNINYIPALPKWVKLKAGKYSNLQIVLNDDNFTALPMLDQNVLITLLIEFGNADTYGK